MDPVSSSYRPPSPSPKQSKVMMQRQYREKEGECFLILRDVIKELSGDELQTRQEILKKVIDMLLFLSEVRQGTTEIVAPVKPDEDPSLTDLAEMELLSAQICNTTSLTSGPHFDFPYIAQPNGEFNLQNTRVGHVPAYQRLHDQWLEYPIVMPNVDLRDLTVDPDDYQEYLSCGRVPLF